MTPCFAIRLRPIPKIGPAAIHNCLLFDSPRLKRIQCQQDKMSAMMLSRQTCIKPVVGSAPALHRARAFRSCRPSRHVVMMAERPIQDDNPAEKAAAKVEDQLEGFVQATKENSGLFQDTISQQPGNKTGKKGSPVDESGAAGGAYLDPFTFMLCKRTHTANWEIPRSAKTLYR